MLIINHILFKSRKLGIEFMKILFYFYLSLSLLVVKNSFPELPLQLMSLDPHVDVSSLLLPGLLHTHGVRRVTPAEVQVVGTLQCGNRFIL